MTNYFCLLSIIGLSNVIVFWKIGKQKLKRSLFSQGYRSWICNLVELRQKWPRLLWGVAWLWWMFHMWTTKALLSCVYDLYKKKHICSVYKKIWLLLCSRVNCAPGEEEYMYIWDSPLNLKVYWRSAFPNHQYSDPRGYTRTASTYVNYFELKIKVSM